MLTPEKIIELIRDDAPCVSDILTEQCMDYHQGFISENPDWWGQLSGEDKSDLLLEQLTEYSGDNHDVHYWSGRYAQMLETPELYLCTRHHDTCNSSGAVAMIMTKDQALAWFKEQFDELPEWDKNWLDYSSTEEYKFHFDDGDGSTLNVEITPAIIDTSVDLF